MVRLQTTFIQRLAFMGLVLMGANAQADRAIGRGQPPEYWSMATTIGRTNSLYITENGEDTASVDFALAPSIILNKDYTLSALLEYYQDLKEEKFDAGRAMISLKKASGFQGLNRRIKLIPRGTLGLPMSQAAKDASLQFSTSVGGRLEMNPDYLVSKKLGLALDLSVSKNWHRYETAVDGTINTQYSSIQGLEVSWAFSDMIGLSMGLNHYDTISYQGVAQDYISHTQELGLSVNPRLSFAVGHAWGNPYVSSRKANGQDINFELQDEENSLVYATMTFLL